MKAKKVCFKLKQGLYSESVRVCYAHEIPVYSLVFGQENITIANELDEVVAKGVVVELDAAEEFFKMMERIPSRKDEKESRHPVELVYRDGPPGIERFYVKFWAEQGGEPETETAVEETADLQDPKELRKQLLAKLTLAGKDVSPNTPTKFLAKMVQELEAA